MKICKKANSLSNQSTLHHHQKSWQFLELNTKLSSMKINSWGKIWPELRLPYKIRKRVLKLPSMKRKDFYIRQPSILKVLKGDTKPKS